MIIWWQDLLEEDNGFMFQLKENCKGNRTTVKGVYRTLTSWRR